MRLVCGWEFLQAMVQKIVRITAGYCMRQLQLVNSTRIAMSGNQLSQSCYLHRIPSGMRLIEPQDRLAP